MIDWARFEELRLEIGEDGIGEVVEIFLEEVEETLEVLGTPQTDEARAARLHFLKGSALNLGFTELAALCDTPAAGAEPATTEAIVASYTTAKTALLGALGRSAA